MKNRKKFVTIALTTALALGCTAPVWAGEPVPTRTQPTGAVAVDTAAQEQEQTMRYTSSVGTVKEINTEGTAKTILVETAQGDKVFYINDNPATNVPNTYLLDGNGMPTTLDALQGKEVRVAHSMATTFSLPPKSSAYAVMEIGDVVPNYAVIEAVQQNADGSVTLTTDNGGMWVTVTADAEVTPHRTKNRVTLADLQPGAEVVLYYDIVLESYPGQAGTNKVILLQAAPEVMDAPAEDSMPAVQETVPMVGLRDAADALQMDIHWNADGQQVILSKGAFNATVTIGSKDYGISRMRLQLGQAAELRDGRTYVPQTFVDKIKKVLSNESV